MAHDHAWLSWHDEHGPKWLTITAWASHFASEKGRTPTLWIDKFCLNQAAIDQSLPCLPIYLAGCHTLLVLPGATYSTRLWCVMELATFVMMGGAKERIVVMPFAASTSPTPADQRRAFDAVVQSLVAFDASCANCFDPSDREGLLAVIEASFGSFDAFNERVRTPTTLAPAPSGSVSVSVRPSIRVAASVWQVRELLAHASESTKVALRNQQRWGSRLLCRASSCQGEEATSLTPQAVSVRLRRHELMMHSAPAVARSNAPSESVVMHSAPAVARSSSSSEEGTREDV